MSFTFDIEAFVQSARSSFADVLPIEFIPGVTAFAGKQTKHFPAASGGETDELRREANVYLKSLGKPTKNRTPLAMRVVREKDRLNAAEYNWNDPEWADSFTQFDGVDWDAFLEDNFYGAEAPAQKVINSRLYAHVEYRDRPSYEEKPTEYNSYKGSDGKVRPKTYPVVIEAFSNKDEALAYMRENGMTIYEENGDEEGPSFPVPEEWVTAGFSEGEWETTASQMFSDAIEKLQENHYGEVEEDKREAVSSLVTSELYEPYDEVDEDLMAREDVENIVSAAAKSVRDEIPF